MTHDAPQHLDWDTACLHCGKELGDDDEVAALDQGRLGRTVEDSLILHYPNLTKKGAEAPDEQ